MKPSLLILKSEKLPCNPPPTTGLSVLHLSSNDDPVSCPAIFAIATQYRSYTLNLVVINSTPLCHHLNFKHPIAQCHSCLSNSLSCSLSPTVFLTQQILLITLPHLWPYSPPDLAYSLWTISVLLHTPVTPCPLPASSHFLDKNHNPSYLQLYLLCPRSYLLGGLSGTLRAAQQSCCTPWFIHSGSQVTV